MRSKVFLHIPRVRIHFLSDSERENAKTPRGGTPVTACIVWGTEEKGLTNRWQYVNCPGCLKAKARYKKPYAAIDRKRRGRSERDEVKAEVRALGKKVWAKFDREQQAKKKKGK